MRVPDRPGQQVRQQTKCRHERGGENMKYISTRGTDYQYSSAQAIKQGIAPDGGLFVPESIPKLSKDDLQRMTTQTYIETAADVLSLYLDDYSHSELLDYCTWAYDPEKFGDDTQSCVKEIFADEAFDETLKEKGVILSSANSINWGRLVPQIAYYVAS